MKLISKFYSPSELAHGVHVPSGATILSTTLRQPATHAVKFGKRIVEMPYITCTGPKYEVILVEE